MDPLSIASAVTGLLALAGTTLTLTISYATRVKHRKEDVEAFVRELEALKAHLESLNELLRRSDGGLSYFHDTSVLTISISAAEAKLDSIRQNIEKANESRIARLTWPFSEKEHERSMQQIRNLLRWVQLALSTDGCKLLSKTSEEVVEILGRQLEEISLLRGVSERQTNIETALEVVEDQTSQMRNEERQRSLDKMLEWLSPHDYEKKHREVSRLRMPETGSWLLENESFASWRDHEQADHVSNVLLCQGIPGSGKTVLMSLVIDHLRTKPQSSNIAVLHVYFDYRKEDQHSITEVLRNFLKQSLAQGPQHTEQPVLDDLEKVTIASIHNFSRCYVVVDAFDECPGRNQPAFMKLFDRLTSSSKIRLIITSRSFSSRTRTCIRASESIHIEAHSEDLRQYMVHQIEQSDIGEAMGREFKLKIINTLVRRSRGMFLLPVLQLSRVLQEPTLGEMEDSLAALPVDLPEMFEATLTRIQQQIPSRRDLAMRAISWILYAHRPLTLFELQNALAIRSWQKNPLSKYQPASETILESCHGLLGTLDDSQQVTFIHYSVQQFLSRRFQIFLPMAQRELAESCITYLSFDEFSHGPFPEIEAIRNRLTSFPLLAYAARYWGWHASAIPGGAQELVEPFLRNQALLANMVQMKYFVKGYHELYWAASEATSHNGLMVACNAGLEGTAIKFVDEGLIPINARSAMGTTAINQACSASQDRTSPSLIRILLNRGADPLIGNWYGNALHCAAEAGNCDAILELVSHGVDPDRLSRLGKTALACTIDWDRFLAASVLLDCGASPTVTNLHGMSFVAIAIYRDSKRVVAMLLERGEFELDEPLMDGMTPLGMALAARSVDVVQLLSDAMTNARASTRRK